MTCVEAPSTPLNGSLYYGQALEFSYFLVPDAADPRAVLETARLTDGLGYELLGVQDRRYQPSHLDTSSLLAAILAHTESVRVFAAERRASSPVPASSPERGG